MPDEEIDKEHIAFCTVFIIDGEVIPGDLYEFDRLVMSSEQILYRDQLNRENTATRMRQRVLNQLAKRNGRVEW